MVVSLYPRPAWRTAGVAAALLGLAVDGTAASRSPASLYLVQPAWPAYEGSASVLRDYIDAMEMAAAGANAGFARERIVPEASWTYLSKSGSRITRLPDGRLRLDNNDYTANWFSHTTCHLQTWPVFTCEDGREIRLKVIGAGRLSDGRDEVRLVEKERQ